MPNQTSAHVYSASIHQSVEPRCRSAIKQYFNRFDFQDNEDQYGIDLVSDKAHAAIELEYRPAFGDTFKFSTYHLLARKKHLFTDPKNGYTPCFCVINRDYTRAMIIDRDKILPYIKGEPKEIYAQGVRDYVYDIPLSAFKLISLN